MAKTGITSQASALGEITRFTELRQRLLFLVGALVVYRIGAYIPVPGLDPNALQNFFQDQSGTILSCLICFLVVPWSV